MGMKVKGDYYCDRCDKPVAAQKPTHRMRNILATLTLPLGGALAYTTGYWHCPHCGGPVRDLEEERLTAQRNAIFAWCVRHWYISVPLAVLTILTAGH